MLHIFTSPVFYRKRSLCPLMVFWLGELMPVFWPVELDLISLKGSAVSSSRFWVVYGCFSLSQAENVQILQFFVFEPFALQQEAADMRQEMTTPSKTFVCDSLGLVRIM